VVESSKEMQRKASEEKAALKLTDSEIKDLETKTRSRPVKKPEVDGRITADILVDRLKDKSKGHSNPPNFRKLVSVRIEEGTGVEGCYSGILPSHSVGCKKKTNSGATTISS
jgi:hypothetical protein